MYRVDRADLLYSVTGSDLLATIVFLLACGLLRRKSTTLLREVDEENIDLGDYTVFIRCVRYLESAVSFSRRWTNAHTRLNFARMRYCGTIGSPCVPAFHSQKGIARRHDGRGGSGELLRA